MAYLPHRAHRSGPSFERSHLKKESSYEYIPPVAMNESEVRSSPSINQNQNLLTVHKQERDHRSDSQSQSHSSIESSYSSSSSSYLEISRSRSIEKSGTSTIFKAPLELKYRATKKKKKTRKTFFRFGNNSSSSSVNSDLAYGTGFIKIPKGLEKGQKKRETSEGSRSKERYSKGNHHGRPTQRKRITQAGSSSERSINSGSDGRHTREKTRQIRKNTSNSSKKNLNDAATTAEIMAVRAGLAKLDKESSRVNLISTRKKSPHQKSSASHISYKPTPSESIYDSDDAAEWESAYDTESDSSVDSKLAYGNEPQESWSLFGGKTNGRKTVSKSLHMDSKAYDNIMKNGRSNDHDPDLRQASRKTRRLHSKDYAEDGIFGLRHNFQQISASPKKVGKIESSVTARSNPLMSSNARNSAGTETSKLDHLISERSKAVPLRIIQPQPVTLVSQSIYEAENQPQSNYPSDAPEQACFGNPLLHSKNSSYSSDDMAETAITSGFHGSDTPKNKMSYSADKERFTKWKNTDLHAKTAQLQRGKSVAQHDLRYEEKNSQSNVREIKIEKDNPDSQRNNDRRRERESHLFEGSHDWQSNSSTNTRRVRRGIQLKCDPFQDGRKNTLSSHNRLDKAKVTGIIHSEIDTHLKSSKSGLSSPSRSVKDSTYQPFDNYDEPVILKKPEISFDSENQQLNYHKTRYGPDHLRNPEHLATNLQSMPVPLGKHLYDSVRGHERSPTEQGSNNKDTRSISKKSLTSSHSPTSITVGTNPIPILGNHQNLFSESRRNEKRRFCYDSDHDCDTSKSRREIFNDQENLRTKRNRSSQKVLSDQEIIPIIHPQTQSYIRRTSQDINNYVNPPESTSTFPQEKVKNEQRCNPSSSQNWRNSEFKFDSGSSHPSGVKERATSPIKLNQMGHKNIQNFDPENDQPRQSIDLNRTQSTTPEPKLELSRTLIGPRLTSNDQSTWTSQQSYNSRKFSKIKPSILPTNPYISKNVSWGENETKHYYVDLPFDRQDEHMPISEIKAGRLPEKNLERTKYNIDESRIIKETEKPGNGALANNIFESGVSNNFENLNESPHGPKIKNDRMTQAPCSSPISHDSKNRPSSITGSSPILSSLKGTHEDDLEFMETVAAGLKRNGFDPEIVDAEFGSCPKKNLPGLLESQIHNHSNYGEVYPEFETLPFENSESQNPLNVLPFRKNQPFTLPCKKNSEQFMSDRQAASQSITSKEPAGHQIDNRSYRYFERPSGMKEEPKLAIYNKMPSKAIDEDRPYETFENNHANIEENRDCMIREKQQQQHSFRCMATPENSAMKPSVKNYMKMKDDNILTLKSQTIMSENSSSSKEPRSSPISRDTTKTEERKNRNSNRSGEEPTTNLIFKDEQKFDSDSKFEMPFGRDNLLPSSNLTKSHGCISPEPASISKLFTGVNNDKASHTSDNLFQFKSHEIQNQQSDIIKQDPIFREWNNPEKNSHRSEHRKSSSKMLWAREKLNQNSRKLNDSANSIRIVPENLVGNLSPNEKNKTQEYSSSTIISNRTPKTEFFSSSIPSNPSCENNRRIIGKMKNLTPENNSKDAEIVESVRHLDDEEDLEKENSNKSSHELRLKPYSLKELVVQEILETPQKISITRESNNEKLSSLLTFEQQLTEEPRNKSKVGTTTRFVRTESLSPSLNDVSLQSYPNGSRNTKHEDNHSAVSTVNMNDSPIGACLEKIIITQEDFEKPANSITKIQINNNPFHESVKKVIIEASQTERSSSQQDDKSLHAPLIESDRGEKTNPAVFGKSMLTGVAPIGKEILNTEKKFPIHELVVAKIVSTLPPHSNIIMGTSKKPYLQIHKALTKRRIASHHIPNQEINNGSLVKSLAYEIGSTKQLSDSSHSQVINEDARSMNNRDPHKPNDELAQKNNLRSSENLSENLSETETGLNKPGKNLEEWKVKIKNLSENKMKFSENETLTNLLKNSSLESSQIINFQSSLNEEPFQENPDILGIEDIYQKKIRDNDNQKNLLHSSRIGHYENLNPNKQVSNEIETTVKSDINDFMELDNNGVMTFFKSSPSVKIDKKMGKRHLNSNMTFKKLNNKKIKSKKHRFIENLTLSKYVDDQSEISKFSKNIANENPIDDGKIYFVQDLKENIISINETGILENSNFVSKNIKRNDNDEGKNQIILGKTPLSKGLISSNDTTQPAQPDDYQESSIELIDENVEEPATEILDMKTVSTEDSSENFVNKRLPENEMRGQPEKLSSRHLTEHIDQPEISLETTHGVVDEYYVETSSDVLGAEAKLTEQLPIMSDEKRNSGNEMRESFEKISSGQEKEQSDQHDTCKEICAEPISENHEEPPSEILDMKTEATEVSSGNFVDKKLPENEMRVPLKQFSSGYNTTQPDQPEICQESQIELVCEYHEVPVAETVEEETKITEESPIIFVETRLPENEMRVPLQKISSGHEKEQSDQHEICKEICVEPFDENHEEPATKTVDVESEITENPSVKRVEKGLPENEMRVPLEQFSSGYNTTQPDQPEICQESPVELVCEYHEVPAAETVEVETEITENQSVKHVEKGLPENEMRVPFEKLSSGYNTTQPDQLNTNQESLVELVDEYHVETPSDVLDVEAKLTEQFPIMSNEKRNSGDEMRVPLQKISSGHEREQSDQHEICKEISAEPISKNHEEPATKTVDVESEIIEVSSENFVDKKLPENEMRVPLKQFSSGYNTTQPDQPEICQESPVELVCQYHEVPADETVEEETEITEESPIIFVETRLPENEMRVPLQKISSGHEKEQSDQHETCKEICVEPFDENHEEPSTKTVDVESEITEVSSENFVDKKLPENEMRVPLKQFSSGYNTTQPDQPEICQESPVELVCEYHEVPAAETVEEETEITEESPIIFVETRLPENEMRVPLQRVTSGRDSEQSDQPETSLETTFGDLEDYHDEATINFLDAEAELKEELPIMSVEKTLPENEMRVPLKQFSSGYNTTQPDQPEICQESPVELVCEYHEVPAAETVEEETEITEESPIIFVETRLPENEMRVPLQRVTSGRDSEQSDQPETSLETTFGDLEDYHDEATINFLDAEAELKEELPIMSVEKTLPEIEMREPLEKFLSGPDTDQSDQPSTFLESTIGVVEENHAETASHNIYAETDFTGDSSKELVERRHLEDEMRELLEKTTTANDEFHSEQPDNYKETSVELIDENVEEPATEILNMKTVSTEDSSENFVNKRLPENEMRGPPEKLSSRHLTEHIDQPEISLETTHGVVDEYYVETSSDVLGAEAKLTEQLPIMSDEKRNSGDEMRESFEKISSGQEKEQSDQHDTCKEICAEPISENHEEPPSEILDMKTEATEVSSGNFVDKKLPENEMRVPLQKISSGHEKEQSDQHDTCKEICAEPISENHEEPPSEILDMKTEATEVSSGNFVDKKLPENEMRVPLQKISSGHEKEQSDQHETFKEICVEPFDENHEEPATKTVDVESEITEVSSENFVDKKLQENQIRETLQKISLGQEKEQSDQFETFLEGKIGAVDECHEQFSTVLDSTEFKPTKEMPEKCVNRISGNEVKELPHEDSSVNYAVQSDHHDNVLEPRIEVIEEGHQEPRTSASIFETGPTKDSEELCVEKSLSGKEMREPLEKTISGHDVTHFDQPNACLEIPVNFVEKYREKFDIGVVEVDDRHVTEVTENSQCCYPKNGVTSDFDRVIDGYKISESVNFDLNDVKHGDLIDGNPLETIEELLSNASPVKSGVDQFVSSEAQSKMHNVILNTDPELTITQAHEVDSECSAIVKQDPKSLDIKSGEDNEMEFVSNDKIFVSKEIITKTLPDQNNVEFVSSSARLASSGDIVRENSKPVHRLNITKDTESLVDAPKASLLPHSNIGNENWDGEIVRRSLDAADHINYLNEKKDQYVDVELTDTENKVSARTNNLIKNDFVQSMGSEIEFDKSGGIFEENLEDPTSRVNVESESPQYTILKSVVENEEEFPCIKSTENIKEMTIQPNPITDDTAVHNDSLDTTIKASGDPLDETLGFPFSQVSNREIDISKVPKNSQNSNFISEPETERIDADDEGKKLEIESPLKSRTETPILPEYSEFTLTSPTLNENTNTTPVECTNKQIKEPSITEHSSTLLDRANLQLSAAMSSNTKKQKRSSYFNFETQGLLLGPIVKRLIGKTDYSDSSELLSIENEVKDNSSNESRKEISVENTVPHFLSGKKSMRSNSIKQNAFELGDANLPTNSESKAEIPQKSTEKLTTVPITSLSSSENLISKESSLPELALTKSKKKKKKKVGKAGSPDSKDELFSKSCTETISVSREISDPFKHEVCTTENFEDSLYESTNEIAIKSTVAKNIPDHESLVSTQEQSLASKMEATDIPEHSIIGVEKVCDNCEECFEEGATQAPDIQTSLAVKTTETRSLCTTGLESQNGREEFYDGAIDFEKKAPVEPTSMRKDVIVPTTSSYSELETFAKIGDEDHKKSINHAPIVESDCDMKVVGARSSHNLDLVSMNEEENIDEGMMKPRNKVSAQETEVTVNDSDSVVNSVAKLRIRMKSNDDVLNVSSPEGTFTQYYSCHESSESSLAQSIAGKCRVIESPANLLAEKETTERTHAVITGACASQDLHVEDIPNLELLEVPHFSTPNIELKYRDSDNSIENINYKSEASSEIVAEKTVLTDGISEMLLPSSIKTEMSDVYSDITKEVTSEQKGNETPGKGQVVLTRSKKKKKKKVGKAGSPDSKDELFSKSCTETISVSREISDPFKHEVCTTENFEDSLYESTNEIAIKSTVAKNIPDHESLVSTQEQSLASKMEATDIPEHSVDGIETVGQTGEMEIKLGQEELGTFQSYYSKFEEKGRSENFESRLIGLREKVPAKSIHLTKHFSFLVGSSDVRKETPVNTGVKNLKKSISQVDNVETVLAMKLLNPTKFINLKFGQESEKEVNKYEMREGTKGEISVRIDKEANMKKGNLISPTCTIVEIGTNNVFFNHLIGGHVTKKCFARKRFMLNVSEAQALFRCSYELKNQEASLKVRYSESMNEALFEKILEEQTNLTQSSKKPEFLAVEKVIQDDFLVEFLRRMRFDKIEDNEPQGFRSLEIPISPLLDSIMNLIDYLGSPTFNRKRNAKNLFYNVLNPVWVIVGGEKPLLLQENQSSKFSVTFQALKSLPFSKNFRPLFTNSEIKIMIKSNMKKDSKIEFEVSPEFFTESMITLLFPKFLELLGDKRLDPKGYSGERRRDVNVIALPDCCYVARVYDTTEDFDWFKSLPLAIGNKKKRNNENDKHFLTEISTAENSTGFDSLEISIKPYFKRSTNEADLLQSLFFAQGFRKISCDYSQAAKLIENFVLEKILNNEEFVTNPNDVIKFYQFFFDKHKIAGSPLSPYTFIDKVLSSHFNSNVYERICQVNDQDCIGYHQFSDAGQIFEMDTQQIKDFNQTQQNKTQVDSVMRTFLNQNFTKILRYVFRHDLINYSESSENNKLPVNELEQKLNFSVLQKNIFNDKFGDGSPNLSSELIKQGKAYDKISTKDSEQPVEQINLGVMTNSTGTTISRFNLIEKTEIDQRKLESTIKKSSLIFPHVFRGLTGEKHLLIKTNNLSIKLDKLKIKLKEKHNKRLYYPDKAFYERVFSEESSCPKNVSKSRKPIRCREYPKQGDFYAGTGKHLLDQAKTSWESFQLRYEPFQEHSNTSMNFGDKTSAQNTIEFDGVVNISSCYSSVRSHIEPKLDRPKMITSDSQQEEIRKNSNFQDESNDSGFNSSEEISKSVLSKKCAIRNYLCSGERDEDKSKNQDFKLATSSAKTHQNYIPLDNSGTLGIGIGMVNGHIILTARLTLSKAIDLGHLSPSQIGVNTDIQKSLAKKCSSEDLDLSFSIINCIVNSNFIEEKFGPLINLQYENILPLLSISTRSDETQSLQGLQTFASYCPVTLADLKRRIQSQGDTKNDKIQNSSTQYTSQSSIPLGFYFRKRTKSIPSSSKLFKPSFKILFQPTPQISYKILRSRNRKTFWDRATEFQPLYLLETNVKSPPRQSKLEDLPALPESPKTYQDFSLIDSNFENITEDEKVSKIFLGLPPVMSIMNQDSINFSLLSLKEIQSLGKPAENHREKEHVFDREINKNAQDDFLIACSSSSTYDMNNTNINTRLDLSCTPQTQYNHETKTTSEKILMQKIFKPVKNIDTAEKKIDSTIAITPSLTVFNPIQQRRVIPAKNLKEEGSVLYSVDNTSDNKLHNNQDEKCSNINYKARRLPSLKDGGQEKKDSEITSANNEVEKVCHRGQILSSAMKNDAIHKQFLTEFQVKNNPHLYSEENVVKPLLKFDNFDNKTEIRHPAHSLIVDKKICSVGVLEANSTKGKIPELEKTFMAVASSEKKITKVSSLNFTSFPAQTKIETKTYQRRPVTYISDIIPPRTNTSTSLRSNFTSQDDQVDAVSWERDHTKIEKVKEEQYMQKGVKTCNSLQPLQSKSTEMGDKYLAIRSSEVNCDTKTDYSLVKVSDIFDKSLSRKQLVISPKPDIKECPQTGNFTSSKPSKAKSSSAPPKGEADVENYHEFAEFTRPHVHPLKGQPKSSSNEDFDRSEVSLFPSHVPIKLPNLSITSKSIQSSHNLAKNSTSSLRVNPSSHLGISKLPTLDEERQLETKENLKESLARIYDEEKKQYNSKVEMVLLDHHRLDRCSSESIDAKNKSDSQSLTSLTDEITVQVNKNSHVTKEIIPKHDCSLQIVEKKKTMGPRSASSYSSLIKNKGIVQHCIQKFKSFDESQNSHSQETDPKKDLRSQKSNRETNTRSGFSRPKAEKSDGKDSRTSTVISGAFLEANTATATANFNRQKRPLNKESSLSTNKISKSEPSTPDNASLSPSLRRSSNQTSGDLRSISQHGAKGDQTLNDPTLAATIPQPNEGRARVKTMADVFDGVGEGYITSPRSPTRPHSLRRRQSMKLIDLESQVENLIEQNRILVDEKEKIEQQTKSSLQTSLTNKDAEIEKLTRTLDWLREEVSRFKKLNKSLDRENSTIAQQHMDRNAVLKTQCTKLALELEQIRDEHQHLTSNFQKEIDLIIQKKDREMTELRNEVDNTKQRIKDAHKQMLLCNSNDAEFLNLRDESYFADACQRLCQHVQQWVLRFSKYSDMKSCRLTREIKNDKIVERLDNAILDGLNVDDYLSDRVRRRDVFMSMVMTMVWEYIFTRYLFGMDRDQRQKLKSLEKTLFEVGPALAVHSWRSITLTLLSKRINFIQQKEQDTQAVIHAIIESLSEILPLPRNYEAQIQEQLSRVIKEAVDLSIEMRCQKAEYIMFPPLQPEYDVNGEIVREVMFNPSLMKDRSDNASNEDLDHTKAHIRIVLFPLVIKKGDKKNTGNEDIVIYPAQVLAAKPRKSAHLDNENHSKISLKSNSPAARSEKDQNSNDVLK